MVRLQPLSFWLFLLLSFFRAVLATEEEKPAVDQLIVQVNLQEMLHPTCLLPLRKEEGKFSEEYIEEITRVLSFDFDQSGSTRLATLTADQQRLIAEKQQLKEVRELPWKTWGIDFVVIPRIIDHSLSLHYINVLKGESKEIHTFSLSGKIEQDRRYLHQVNDAIIREWGGTGIATSKILYTIRRPSSEQNPSSEVWQVDYDGHNAKMLIRERNIIVTPTYFPPQKGHLSGSFLYVSYRIGQPKIYISSLHRPRGRRFSYLRGNQLMPAISPHRDTVVFVCDVAGSPDLFLQRYSPTLGPVGKPEQLFAIPRATQASPAFSPDGRQLAFVSNKDGLVRIYVLDIEGWTSRSPKRKVALISKKSHENTAPTWSPDGKKLAYSAMHQGVRQICIYDFETKKEEVITEGNLHKENPSWAPNSVSLVYNTSLPTGKEEGGDLYMIDIYRRQPRKVMSSSSIQGFPSWEPLI